MMDASSNRKSWLVGRISGTTEGRDFSRLSVQWRELAEDLVRAVELGQFHEARFQALTKNFHDLRCDFSYLRILAPVSMDSQIG